VCLTFLISLLCYYQQTSGSEHTGPFWISRQGQTVLSASDPCLCIVYTIAETRWSVYAHSSHRSTNSSEITPMDLLRHIGRPLAIIHLTNAGSCPFLQRCCAAPAARSVGTRGTTLFLSVLLTLLRWHSSVSPTLLRSYPTGQVRRKES
jgi:hypothetical protein